MPSGRHLTAEDKLRIMRLASQRTGDGRWTLTIQEIAERLGLHRETVRRVIRDGCKLYCESVTGQRRRA